MAPGGDLLFWGHIRQRSKSQVWKSQLNPFCTLTQKLVDNGNVKLYTNVMSNFTQMFCMAQEDVWMCLTRMGPRSWLHLHLNFVWKSFPCSNLAPIWPGNMKLYTYVAQGGSLLFLFHMDQRSRSQVDFVWKLWSNSETIWSWKMKLYTNVAHGPRRCLFVFGSHGSKVKFIGKVC